MESNTIGIGFMSSFSDRRYVTEFLSSSHLFVTTLDLYPPSYVLKTAAHNDPYYMRLLLWQPNPPRRSLYNNEPATYYGKGHNQV